MLIAWQLVGIMNDAILLMNSIVKKFPGVNALRNVDFELRKGEVHALLGENGAGKSTLMKCLSGIHTIDSGSISLDGKKIEIKSVQDAIRNNISIIHQELVLCEELTIAENIFMGREPIGKCRLTNKRKLYNEAQKIIDRIDSSLNVYRKVNSLSTAQKQMVEIAKALSMNVRILIMDEPTAMLSQREVNALFLLIRSLRDEGISIVYISHRMEEIFHISDRITVLRDGMLIKTLETSKTNNQELIDLMVGRKLEEYYVRTDHNIGGTIFEAKNINRYDGRVVNANFHLRKGEVLGFAGLVGSGRTELMRAIFGIDRFVSGEILINDKPVVIRTVEDAINLGIGMVPEDRKLEGLFLHREVMFNITLGVLGRFISLFRIDHHKEDMIADQYIDMLSIKVSSRNQVVETLSGGNQQKVVLSKWLVMSPNILILDEPTRGIDVGAKAEVYAIIDDLAKKGISIILVSSEMMELINICDRIYVMCNGHISTCLHRNEMKQETILKHALGVNEYARCEK
ncbi:MAG: sugar ABC transporter ATP-binding protein [Christensenellales bacterium]